MKKIIILSAALLGFNLASNAQSGPSTANQNVNLNLSNAIVITYNSIGGATNGTDVNIPFTTVADYQNGVVESGTEHLFVQSNLKFNVTVATTSTEFSFTGSGSNPHMPVSGVLAAQVFNNNTRSPIINRLVNYTRLITALYPIAKRHSKFFFATDSVSPNIPST